MTSGPPFTRYLLLMFAALSLTLTTSRAETLRIYVSSFAAGEKGAIHACDFDTTSGVLKSVQRNQDVEHPFFLALSPNRQFLYSIDSKQFGGKQNDNITSFRIASDGRLTRLNQQSALGTAACYLAVDASGSALLVANYSSGSVASLPIQPDGTLGKAASFHQHVGSSVNEKRQKEPHAHCIVVSPNNRFVYAADLGVDKILNYRLSSKQAKLAPNEPQSVASTPGAGPRHLTFHPKHNWLYAINELGNTITQFGFDTNNGKLAKKSSISTVPDSFEGVSHTADLKITPDGKFLYGTNRGHDSIASYQIGDNGSLTRLAITPSLGGGPQNLAITPDGKWLICANMPGNNVVVFRISPKTGAIKAVGAPLSVEKPSCIMIH